MNMKCTELDYLFDAIKTLDEKDEFYNFFQDLCTIDELHEMGQRFEVARLLDVVKITIPSANQRA